MKRIISILVVLICAAAMVACQTALAAQDVAGPSIDHIETSTKVMAKSDCSITSVTVTADITDQSGIKQVALWYRVGADQPYTPVDMSFTGGKYSVTVKALDVQLISTGVYGWSAPTRYQRCHRQLAVCNASGNRRTQVLIAFGCQELELFTEPWRCIRCWLADIAFKACPGFSTG